MRTATKTATLSIRLTPELKQALEKLAELESRNVSGQVAALVREKCKKLGIEVKQ